MATYSLPSAFRTLPGRNSCLLASQKLYFLQKLRFQTTFQFSVHRLCESVIGFDASLRLTALSLTLSHGERGRVAVTLLFAA